MLSKRATKGTTRHVTGAHEAKLIKKLHTGRRPLGNREMLGGPLGLYFCRPNHPSFSVSSRTVFFCFYVLPERTTKGTTRHVTRRH